jgi:riboflavin kinase/FMN adenylyltransferase
MLKSSSISKKDKITSLAIGGFDGIHLAHRHLLSKLDRNGGLLIVDKDFDQALTPKKERCRYTKHDCFFLDFQEIKDMSAEAFLHFLKEHFPNLQKVVVGYDFRFGKKRKGTPKLLKELPSVEVVVVQEQKKEGLSIHANTIRTFLKEGNVEKANMLLGRSYAIYGRVISGQGLGKKRLYPTFNIDPGRYLVPKDGVYISETVTNEGVYPSVTFVGTRLSTDGSFSIETHLLTEEDVPTQHALEIRFLKYLRENRKFENLDALKEQIGADIEETKRYFRCAQS